MRYKLNTLYSTEQAFNGDVITSDDEKYVGRLYILATSDNQLLNFGIKEEWFLAYTGADFLISGHINHDGNWSLSAYKSLEPSFQYTNQSDIFDRVFSQKYIQEIAYLREEEFLKISQHINQPDDFNSEEEDEFNTDKLKDMKKSVQFYIKPENIDILNNLIFKSNLDQLYPLNQEQKEVFEIDEKQPNRLVRSTLDDSNQNLQITMNYFQRESAPKLDEDELNDAQIKLIGRIMTEYQTRKIPEFEFLPFGNVAINTEEGYFILRDLEDEHTIFIASFEAEIIQGLNDIDALTIEMILSQLETEDYRRIRDTSKQQEITSLSNENSRNSSQQQGIEYGT